MNKKSRNLINVILWFTNIIVFNYTFAVEEIDLPGLTSITTSPAIVSPISISPATIGVVDNNMINNSSSCCDNQSSNYYSDQFRIIEQDGIKYQFDYYSGYYLPLN
jgi:hypothetical protein